MIVSVLALYFLRPFFPPMISTFLWPHGTESLMSLVLLGFNSFMIDIFQRHNTHKFRKLVFAPLFTVSKGALNVTIPQMLMTVMLCCPQLIFFAAPILEESGAGPFNPRFKSEK